MTVTLDPQLAKVFADHLSRERKSLAQLERVLQETIIIPFTQLHLSRNASGKSEVVVTVKDEQIVVSV